MNRLKYAQTALVLFLFISNLTSQNAVIDSLKNELKTNTNETIRARIYLDIASEFEDINTDSLFFYFEKAVALCDEHLPDEIKKPVTDSILYTFVKYKGIAYHTLGDNLKDLGKCDEAEVYLYGSIELHDLIDLQSELARNYTPLGICQFFKGNYDGAIEYFQKGQDVYLNLGNQQLVAAAYVNIGVIYRHQGLYDRAIENYLESLKVFTELGHIEGEARAYMNIGVIHNYLKNYDLAIEFYKSALELFEELENRRESLRIYNNIGIVYNNMGNNAEDEETKQEYYLKSLEYYYNTIELAKEINDKIALSAALSNIGTIYSDMNNYDKALINFNDALVINRELNDRAGIALVYVNLADLYNSLADLITEEDDNSVNLIREKLNKALDYGEKAYSIALDISSNPIQHNAAQKLISVYRSIGDSDKALEYALIYIEVNEEIYNEERARALTEMQTKYEAEKNELEIQNLNKERALGIAELAKSEEQRKKQLIIIYSFVVGFIIIVVFSLIILRLFIQKKKANLLLAEQKRQIEQKNTLLEEANEEIKSQKEELEVQHDMVVNQKNFIETQKLRIDDSIRYAQRIQKAVLPTDEHIDSLFSDYFILYKPKDVVSGDFYWAGSNGNWNIVVAADCTGHGVPGAFMSMLGISFLNQITSKIKITDAASLLEELREAVINALKQDHSLDSQIDGMDISLAVINKKTYKCHWAGAYNPLWIIRDNTDRKNITETDEIVEEIVGDRMPIALHYRMKKFTNHEIQLYKGDKIYLYSDGFADQFGGLNNRKFSRKEFKKLVVKTSVLTMKEQETELDKAFNNWKNPNKNLEYEQIDDMVIFGLQL